MKKAPIIGVVTPPEDLELAVRALGDMGKAWLKKTCKGREIRPVDIAKAADFERGELKNG